MSDVFTVHVTVYEKRHLWLSLLSEECVCVSVPSPGGAMGCQEEDESPQLLRTRSDASFMRVQRRPKTHTARDLQRLRTQRFSINGHFYNHKVP